MPVKKAPLKIPEHIKAKEIRIVPIEEIKENPRNRNRHSKEQIDRLAEIITYQGFRTPVVISNRSGLLVAGHGRLQAALQLGFKEIPALFQDFESEEQEIAAGVSDNAIASWAELDLAGINADIGELGPDFDIDLLGIRDFVIEPAEWDNPGAKADPKDKDFESMNCPNCGVLIERSNG